MKLIFKSTLLILIFAVLSACTNHSNQTPSDYSKPCCQQGGDKSSCGKTYGGKSACMGNAQGCSKDCSMSGKCGAGTCDQKSCSGCKSGCGNKDKSCPYMDKLKEKCAGGCKSSCAKLKEKAK